MDAAQEDDFLDFAAMAAEVLGGENATEADGEEALELALQATEEPDEPDEPEDGGGNLAAGDLPESTIGPSKKDVQRAKDKATGQKKKYGKFKRFRKVAERFGQSIGLKPAKPRVSKRKFTKEERATIQRKKRFDKANKAILEFEKKEAQRKSKAAAGGAPLKLAAAGYPWERHKDGLLVKGVELMSLIDPGERPDFGLPAPGVDPAWMLRAVKTAEMMRDKGKFPRVLRQHNQPMQAAEVIGKIVNVRWQSPWLTGDLLITKPEAAGKLARGEFPSRSAEFRFESAYLHGLALIEGAEGHFDEELPDFQLADAEGMEELRRLGVPAEGKDRRLNLADAPLKLMEGGAAGDWAEMYKSLRSLYEELSIRVAGLEKKKDAAGLGAPGDAATAKLAAENAMLNAELNIGRGIAQLQAAKSPLTTEQMRAQLGEPKTEEGRAERLRFLLNAAQTANSAPSQPPQETPQSKLEREYAKMASLTSGKLPFTLEDLAKVMEAAAAR